jgi:hypothetical protein
VGLRAAVRAALAADTASIAVMELADNAVILAVPGAMDAGLGAALFWAALAFSLVVAFLVTLPLNRWLIGRGKGHAVLHAPSRDPRYPNGTLVRGAEGCPAPTAVVTGSS